ncbi:MAG: MBL fold metallo-hydrolase, partial [Lachnospiraceae bacterium]|nr:MBL fold metallo-hydrolase [Lachnospiraceae bacterium]
HEVTGSATLIELNGKFFLVDYGMEQGKNVFENVPLPIEPSQIEAVFLTHAHIDHSGMLPKLYKDGFRGAIYATDATCNLCRIMLKDSAHIQEQEFEWKSRKAARAGREVLEPVYTVQDAENVIQYLRPCEYGTEYQANEGVTIRFTDIGHLLGSACIEIWLTEGDVTKKIVFSGDIGNKNKPILKNPQSVESADYVVIESTYGTRLHEEARKGIATELASIIQRTLDRRGNLVIPAFAVGRTQELLYAIRKIKDNNMVTGHDHFPVYIDSPLAEAATSIFMQCDMSYFDETMQNYLKQGINPIWNDDIRFSSSAEESKAINFDPEPKVILSASGMCDAGRIRHHLKHNLWKHTSTILFAGYQAEGSLGRALLDGIEEVTLFGERINVCAEIAHLHGASGHADQAGLLEWIEGFTEKPSLVFVNHGEDSSVTEFAALLHEKFGFETVGPYSGTEYDLITGEPLVVTQGVRVEKPSVIYEKTYVSLGRKKADATYSNLILTCQRLLDTAKGSRELTNKELARMQSEVASLLSKWTL